MSPSGTGRNGRHEPTPQAVRDDPSRTKWSEKRDAKWKAGRHPSMRSSGACWSRSRPWRLRSPPWQGGRDETQELVGSQPRLGLSGCCPTRGVHDWISRYATVPDARACAPMTTQPAPRRTRRPWGGGGG
eukprot:scaffold84408_cov33-Tisochrysis_lutea.AAC.7